MSPSVVRCTRTAIDRAVEFLLRRQGSDGAWRDFQLKPGRSDAWVTAYVGSRLAGVARAEPRSVPPAAIASAIRFVEGARHSNGGWGYNGDCPPDADSTARALLFLRAAGGDVRLRDYAALVRFALPDGAFATYRSADARAGWCRGHPDVTVVALRALNGVLAPGHVIMRRGRARLAAYLARRDGTAAYWWTTPFYVAREVLAFSTRCARAAPFALPRLALPSNAGCFERALACEVAVLQRDAYEAARCMRRLVAEQRDDGGWPSVPILRVVNPQSKKIGDRSCRLSPVVADDREILTTATVVGALALAASCEKTYAHTA